MPRRPDAVGAAHIGPTMASAACFRQRSSQTRWVPAFKAAKPDEFSPGTNFFPDASFCLEAARHRCGVRNKEIDARQRVIGRGRLEFVRPRTVRCRDVKDQATLGDGIVAYFRPQSINFQFGKGI